MSKENILKKIYPENYQKEVIIYAEQYNIDKNLIFAVIKTESNFNATAKSNKNAAGLMQIMEATALDVANRNGIEINKEKITEELYNPSKNIHIGIAYLASLINRYGNIELALAAYNAGIGTVDNWINKSIIQKDGTDIEKIPYKETNYYVRKVLRDYETYNKLYV